MLKALDVAKYLLNIAYQNGDIITNLKMQKLLYYAQAWYLVNADEKLFSDDILAWKFGPVIKEVYDTYKNYGVAPIIIDNFESEFNECIYSEKEKEYLDDFSETFFSYSATELVNLTHTEDPWKQAVNTENKVISPVEMKRYYEIVLENEQKEEIS